MLLRKFFFYWQFIAVVLLPLWLVIGWPIFGAGGWKVLGVFFGAVVLGLALLIVSLLFYARKDVRETKTVSWSDVGVLFVWHALIIGVGFYATASPWLSVLVIVIGVAAFWFALWELFAAARRRVRTVIENIENNAKPAYLQPQQGASTSASTGASTDAGDSRASARDPNVIVIREKPAQP